MTELRVELPATIARDAPLAEALRAAAAGRITATARLWMRMRERWPASRE